MTNEAIRRRAYVGRTVRSARSCSLRAISIGSPVSTSLAASRQTSCWAERISHSMISMAKSFWSRLTRPATRYQPLVARSWGSIGLPCTTFRCNVNAYERVDNPEVTMIRTWSAHERVAVKRGKEGE
jgi:hypothetical protein